MKSTPKKRAQYLKKRNARFATHQPNAATARFHRRPAIAHKGTLTDAAIRAIYAVTGDQL